MDVYDQTPVPLPADLAERIETEHVRATLAAKMLLATIAVVLFDANAAAHTTNGVHAFLTLDEERRAQSVDMAGAIALQLENNGDADQRDRAAVARPGLDFFRFEWPLYAYSKQRDQIVGYATTLLAAVAPGGLAPAWLRRMPAAKAPEMNIESLRAWLEHPGGAARARLPTGALWRTRIACTAHALLRAIRGTVAPAARRDTYARERLGDQP